MNILRMHRKLDDSGPENYIHGSRRRGKSHSCSFWWMNGHALKASYCNKHMLREKKSDTRADIQLSHERRSVSRPNQKLYPKKCTLSGIDTLSPADTQSLLTMCTHTHFLLECLEWNWITDKKSRNPTVTPDGGKPYKYHTTETTVLRSQTRQDPPFRK